jgi:serine O-acetyltransferase
MKSRLKFLISYLILYPFWIVIKSMKKIDFIIGDISYWLKCYHRSQTVNYNNFVWLMSYHKAFRNVLYYRIKGWSNLVSWLYSSQDTTFITGEPIGKGLFLCHGFATSIGARSIGENCWINQQVTIGHANGGDPTIGNNVKIFAGAIVVGDITLGDNAIICAGAVVTKDVPKNGMALGNPAKVVVQEFFEE